MHTAYKYMQQVNAGGMAAAHQNTKSPNGTERETRNDVRQFVFLLHFRFRRTAYRDADVFYTLDGFGGITP